MRLMINDYGIKLFLYNGFFSIKDVLMIKMYMYFAILKLA